MSWDSEESMVLVLILRSAHCTCLHSFFSTLSPSHPSLEMNFTRGSFLNVCLTFFKTCRQNKLGETFLTPCLLLIFCKRFSHIWNVSGFLRVFSVDQMDHGWANVWARQKSHGIYGKGALFNKWEMGVSWETMQPSHSSLQELYNRAIRRKTWEV